MARQGLLPQQELFVHHYLLCHNATLSVKKAGYADPSYGPQILRNPTVRRHLARANDALARKFEATKERIVLELARLGYADPGDLKDEEGNFKPLELIPPEVRAAIASVKETTITDKDGKVHKKVEYKLWDKPKVLEMLSKHTGVFTDVPISLNVYRDIPTPVLQARLRYLAATYIRPLLEAPAAKQVIDVTDSTTCLDSNVRLPVIHHRGAGPSTSISKGIKGRGRQPTDYKGRKTSRSRTAQVPKQGPPIEAPPTPK